MAWNHARETITDDEAKAIYELAALAVEAARAALPLRHEGASERDVAVLAAALVRRYPV